MSHVTQEQAKKLKELGYPQPKGRFIQRNPLLDPEAGWDWYGDGELTAFPSAEELMEWIKDRIDFLCEYYADEWHVGDHLSDGDTVKDFHSPSLATALYECACWVLEGKK